MPGLWPEHPLGHGKEPPPSISIHSCTTEAVNSFTNRGFTITILTMDTYLKNHIGKVHSTFEKLTTRSWNNSELSVKTKIQVFVKLNPVWK